MVAERSKPKVEPVPFAGTNKYPEGLMIGLDVGSTTVKAVVIDVVTDEILWKDYQRHDTKQPEKVLEFLQTIEAEFPDVERNAFRLFVTGSGGSAGQGGATGGAGGTTGAGGAGVGNPPGGCNCASTADHGCGGR